MLDHKLTIFYHTAKHLNTTKAAEILRLSQPAISKSIKELEKGLGITLFDREKGRLMLTPAGKYLLEQSEELIERERIITFNLQHMKKEFSGTLHIGASTTLSQYILPEYLARFRETHPYIEINLISVVTPTRSSRNYWIKTFNSPSSKVSPRKRTFTTSLF